MRGNPGLDLAYTCERAVPSQLQFRRDQPVLRIDGVILSECPIGAVARRLEVARQRITNLIAAAGRLGFGLSKQGCAGFSAGSAIRRHKFSRSFGRTSSPLRSSLSFRYTQ